MFMSAEIKQKLSKRRRLRRKDANKLKEEVSVILKVEKFQNIGQAEIEDGTLVYLFDGEVYAARNGGKLYPTLKNPDLDDLPSVFVDMGAIPYICNGADIMAPGIVEIRNDFEKDTLLIIRDIQHRKALAVGLARYSSDQIKNMIQGKVIVNIHHVGDKLWKVIH
jgi:PUA domain protein